MSRKPGIPAYRTHQSGQARVRINGRDYYLGPHGSAESKAEYNRLVKKLLADRAADELKASVMVSTDLTVNELVASYMEHASSYYARDGKPTEEVAHIGSALRPVKEKHGHELVSSFGPLKLKAIREQWVNAGLVRAQVNKRMGRVCRCFAWGVEEELVPVAVLQALKAIKGLRRGHTLAPEGRKVRPVPTKSIEAIKPFVNRQVRAMLELQAATGMRPGETVIMRAIDIDVSGTTWRYRPHFHKTENADKDRVIALGKTAQEILRSWLKTDDTGYLFSPAEARAERMAELRKNRKSKIQPSQKDRSKPNPRRAPGERYTTRSFYHAVRDACDKAKIPRFHPNQIRHLFGTIVRHEMGLEASQVAMGHARCDITQVYAEKNAALADQVALRFG